MFFVIVISSFLAISSYVFIRGYQALPPVLTLRIIYAVLFASGFISFFLRMYLGDRVHERVAVPLSDIGFTFIIALVYFALIALGVDILRLINYFIKIFPEIILRNWALSKQILLYGSLLTVFTLLIIGNINFNNPSVTRYNITTDKKLPGGEMKIVLASDFHLSSYINAKHLRRYVELINSQQGDIVALAGDIADRDVRPLKEQNMGYELSKLNAKYGVFAVTGNHEFYGGNREEIYELIRGAGISLLLDSAVHSPFGFVIAGRDDMTNRKRASLDSILAGFDLTLPVILLDHQPKHLSDARLNGIDIQLSGHTHRGQFWPGSILVDAMFDLAYGHRKIEKTDYVVTSGIGLWGPKFRIGTKSEVVVIEWKELPATTGTTASESTSSKSSESTASAESSSSKTTSSKSSGSSSSTREH